MSGDERADEVVGAVVDGIHVVFGIVSFVKDESDVGCGIGKQLASIRNFPDDVAEGDRVVLIAGIRVMKERYMAIGGDQKRQAQNAQIVPAFLAVTALGKFRMVIEGIYKGKEIGGVKKQVMHLEAKNRNGS